MKVIKAAIIIFVPLAGDSVVVLTSSKGTALIGIRHFHDPAEELGSIP